MTNGYEHLMDMSDAGTLSVSGVSASVPDGDERVVLLYGGGNETGLLATERYLDIGATVAIADEPDNEQAVVGEFGDVVDFLEIDPLSFQSIKEAATKFRQEYGDLDVLASTKSAVYPTTDEEPTPTYAVNHLALYCLYYNFEDMMYRCRTLVPVHPIIDDIGPLNEDEPGEIESDFARSQHANAALIVAIHIQRWDRTINGYDPGIVVHDDRIPEAKRLSTVSDPEAAADRLVHISSAGTAGILRGGYYGDTVEEIGQQLDDFKDEYHLWDVSTPEYHKLPLSQEESEAVLHRDAELCGLDPDWYKTGAWWLDADRGPTGY